MPDILNIGVSALLANRSALDVAGHNIANANTDGYTRQRVDMTARLGALSGYGFAGAGVQISAVQRLGDQFIFAREISSQSALSRADQYNTIASRVDTLLSDSSTGLGSSLNGFFDSLSALASDPASTPTRQSVLSATSSLTARFQDLQSQLDDAEHTNSAQISQTVDEINSYASTIAKLNDRIAQAIGSSGGQIPNDLVDQRDQAVRELSKRVSVSTVPQDDGSLNVFVANGQSLVVGTTTSPLGVRPNEFDSGRLEVTSSATGPVISNQLGGGTLGGLLDARREVLDPTREKLGRLAISVSSAVNSQQAQGIDQYGNFGAPLFKPLTGVALASYNNTGSATVGVGFADPTALDGKEYLLSYNGSAWAMTDSTTGAAVPVTGTGTAADPFVAKGLSLTVSGTPAAGDRFLVAPGAHAASQLQMAISDAGQLAAAAPILGSAVAGNTGSGTISAGSVVDINDPNLRTPATIQFTSATTYSINGAGSYSYSAGSAITANGWSVSIDGAPAVGDKFTVSPTGINSGDSRNAQLLSGLSSKALLDGGRNSIGDANAQMVEQVGATAQQAKLQLDAQTSLQSQTQSERNALSGVNLDEEASDLLRFQQAYQAAAQIISTASTVFDSLLAATRH